jgi:hypothetical protein
VSGGPGAARLEVEEILRLAARIRELQRGRTGSADEAEVARIFTGARGADLTALKNAVDETRDHRDLHQLLFHDVDDDALRESILDHFAREAAPSGEVKILSDIDDTLYANWKDRRYPKKTVYPGVLQLHKELDRGPGEQRGRAGDLTFVTARPGDRIGLVETSTRGALSGLGVEGATVLTGGFTRLLTNRSIAMKKLENFHQYRRIYPEYGFVFIGDSGQGDIHFGVEMLAAAPGSVRTVLIHDVVATPEEARREYAQGGVRLFDSYVGAAVEALELGLISPAGAARVAHAARAELAAIAFASELQAAARWVELDRDLARLDGALPPADRLSGG